MRRLKEQRYQTDRLTLALNINSQKRDALLDDKKHAMLMLDSLKNVGQETTAEWVKSLKMSVVIFISILSHTRAHIAPLEG